LVANAVRQCLRDLEPIVEDAIDPLCVVQNDDFTMFGPYGDVSGKWTPPPDFAWPI
jgi:hypothetical protein